MEFDHPVHDGDVATFDLEDEDLPGLDGVVLVVGEEEQVPSVERWLHATTTHTSRAHITVHAVEPELCYQWN